MDVLTYRVLVIFLLLSFAGLFKEAEAQGKAYKSQMQLYEEQLLMNLGVERENRLNGTNEIDLQVDYYYQNTEYIDNQREALSLDQDGNYIRLYMQGDQNKATASQYGKGNAMDLGITADDIETIYLQQGNYNYIYDRVTSNKISREIYQIGNYLGIYNQGMQEIPMIINQSGQGMKIIITGPPGSP